MQNDIVQVFVLVILILHMRFLFFIAIILLPCAAISEQGKVGAVSGLAIPRFVSLKSNEVNVRVGPGVDYPIKMVYQRANLPMEVVAEFGNWRKVRDVDGMEGWVLHSLLSGKRYAILTTESPVLNVYEGSRAVARFAKNVQVSLQECRESQCEVELEDEKGWIEKPNLWGVYGHEKFD